MKDLRHFSVGAIDPGSVVDTVWRTEDVAAEDARWAMSAGGRALLAELVAAPHADALTVATRLRADGHSPARAATAQGVAAASVRAWRTGQPDGTWWTPSAAEQASHPVVSAWRARRFDGQRAVDLTAGCGGDALALEAVASTLLACDRSAARTPFLRANLPGHAHVVQGDARRPPVPPASWWGWADPGRRVAGRRVRGLGHTVPPVPALARGGWAGLGVAVSPALDLDDPDRPRDAELEFVQVGRQLVEATLWLGACRDRGPGAPATASATLLPEGHHLRGTPTATATAVADVGEWLAEPAPALVRARLVDAAAAELGLARLARRRALFTGARPVTSPWFRTEAVEAVVPARPARVRDALQALDPLPVEIVTHGQRLDLQAWWRALGSPPRGPSGRAVHVARLDQGSVAILTRRHRD